MTKGTPGDEVAYIGNLVWPPKNMLIEYFLVDVDERVEEVSGGGCKERPQKIGKGMYSFSILAKYPLVQLL